MKTAMLIARIITGLVFIFSGFVKAVDPTGSAIKFEEYFLAFHMDFLMITSLPLSIIQSAAEIMIGLNLIAGIRMKFTAWLLMIFMSFFTLLTFVLALTNPVTDCGCFGDAVKLTNWQTFWKNVVLLLPTLVVFFKRNKYPAITTKLAEWLITAANFLIPVILSVYCLLHEPLLDFRPYQIGTAIPEKMSIPEGAPVDKYETMLIYQKNGVVQEFTESNFPWQDTTWKWVETRQKLIFRGYEPPIHDFSITNSSGTDITDQVLADRDYVLLIIAPKLEKAAVKGMKKLNELAMKADNLGFKVYCLTSSTNREIENFNNNMQPVFEVCTTDETTLKTIMRSNPGLLILREGTVLAKWNHRDIPEVNKLKSDLNSYLLDLNRLVIEKFTVWLIATIILLLYSLIALVLVITARRTPRIHNLSRLSGKLSRP